MKKLKKEETKQIYDGPDSTDTAEAGCEGARDLLDVWNFLK